MTTEMWQFLAVGSVGLGAGTLWFMLIYKPRRSWDGDKSPGETGEAGEEEDTDRRHPGG
jgi:hypothetical protein